MEEQIGPQTQEKQSQIRKKVQIFALKWFSAWLNSMYGIIYKIFCHRVMDKIPIPLNNKNSSTTYIINIFLQWLE